LNAVKGLSDIINHPGIINVDFADVKTIMKDTGDAIMGVGEGVGENRVADAVEHAINNVLLEETSIAGASSLLINVTGGNDLTINDWNEVSQVITGQVDTNANIIIGLNEEEGLNEKIRVTVIATGFRARLPHTLTSLKARTNSCEQSATTTASTERPKRSSATTTTNGSPKSCEYARPS
jgi:cell division protein FtsZ